jgi:hypothetical protein
VTGYTGGRAQRARPYLMPSPVIGREVHAVLASALIDMFGTIR